jgi:tripartite-type tricarboxylate transporter receptor subunit TctC
MNLKIMIATSRLPSSVLLRRSSGMAVAFVAAFALLLSMPRAGAAEYYAGKTIDLVVGSDPGGGYDIYARALARHLPRHIPGNPTITVKNMPGAGSSRAGVFVSTVAPKDGTSMAALMPGAIIGPLLDDKPNLAFDPTRVVYIGTTDSGVRVCTTFQSSKIKTFEDAQRQKTVVGATAAGGATRDYAYLHNKTAGTKFEVVSGYQGTVDIALAMERGEVDGLCGWDWSSVKSQKADWVRDKKLNLLVQVSLKSLPELDALGVPQIWKFITNESDRTVAELVVSQQVFQRSYVVPPETPAQEIEILRKGFDETVRDPQFLADGEKLRISIAPLGGVEVQEVVKRLYATPKSFVERAKSVIKP